MARKAIPDQTQNAILLKSRRRCCLCFWLKGEDEVKKGQLAHLDQDHENSAEGNLVFLCLEHHDEYDGTTSVSKGLREAEVRQWRDELYREMQHRFRTVKSRGFELILAGFQWKGPDDEFFGVFRLKNTGDVSERNPVVTIRLPDNVAGKIPPMRFYLDSYSDHSITFPDPFAMDEDRQDLFEPNGRVAVKSFGGQNPILMPGHHWEFDGLLFRVEFHLPGFPFELQYRVDAEDAPPTLGVISGVFPAEASDFLTSSDEG